MDKLLSPPKKPKKRFKSPKIPLEDGLTVDCSRPSELLEDNDSTISNNSSETKLPINQKQKNPNNSFAIVESLPKGKKTTSKDKSPTCSKDSQTIESLQTLDQGLISGAKVSVPFWNCQAKDLSPKLWLPIETDCVALRSNWCNGSFNSMEHNSWFSIKKWTPQDKQNWPKISWPSSTFSIAESMESENIKVKGRTNKLKKSTKPVANRCKKVRLHPNPEVTNILKRWFGCVRTTYNWALACIKKNPKPYKPNAIWLRKRFINKCNIPKDKRFLLDCPKHVRDTAIHDLAEAYKSNFQKKKKNPNHTFDLKFRKRKDNQSITIPWDAIKDWDIEKNEFKMFPTFLQNKIKFHVRNKKSVPDKVTYDTKLLMDKLGRFYLVIVYYDSPCENQTGSNQDTWCSIDPGVRTMLTIYSPTPGQCFKIGDRDISRIYRLCKGLDKLISITSQAKGRSKKRKLKAQIRLRERIKNLVTEVHCKAIRFILQHFNKIIIPPFQVSQMIKRVNRKISSQSVRQMVCWKHYTFRKRLQEVSQRHPNVEVFIRDEGYTSKTCTHCGTLKQDLGGAKCYKCMHCNLRVDRDINGSRNIFLKNALG